MVLRWPRSQTLLATNNATLDIVICSLQIQIFYGRYFTWVLKTRLIEKKYPSFLLMPNFHKLQEDSKNVSLKIGSKGPKKLGPFSHFSSWEKRLSSGQKWFLRPYFPLIRGIFLLKSGLRFSFRALEVPEPRVRKRPLSLTNRAFSSLSVWALPVPETKI